MCGITTQDHVSLQGLLGNLQPDDLVKVFCIPWLRWHSHVERSYGWLKKVQELNTTEFVAMAALRKPVKEVISMDCPELGLRPTFRQEPLSSRLRSTGRLDPPLY